MKKLNLLVALIAFIFAIGLVACNNNGDYIDEDKYTQIKVDKDTINIDALANNSSYIKANVNADIWSINLVINNKDTTFSNTTYPIFSLKRNALMYVYHDTLTAYWCKAIKTNENPATYRICVNCNDTGQKRKATLTLDGLLLRSANVTIIQQAN